MCWGHVGGASNIIHLFRHDQHVQAEVCSQSVCVDLQRWNSYPSCCMVRACGEGRGTSACNEGRGVSACDEGRGVSACDEGRGVSALMREGV